GVDSKIHKISGTRIAREELGINKPNMVMLGALLKVAPVVKLESLIKVTKERFKGVIGEKNAKAMRIAYNEVTGDETV
ncbi:MAG: 2-oxoacid:acceptor oxidoreductase family protein, partial [Candidatus Heimdallarchaeota archaeon]|nr:2-oxoacid:acceptor oxidoreductase family protein [Candidatus Heimdallarchaeota archaeon]